MQRMKSTWKRLPDKPRRILTLIIGLLLIVTSALIGWIPGPGGMVPFLLGIAILASEFAWAERLRDSILNALKHTGAVIKRRPYLTTVLIVLALASVSLCAYVFYTQIL